MTSTLVHGLVPLAYRPAHRAQPALDQLVAHMRHLYPYPLDYHVAYTLVRAAFPADDYPFDSVGARLVGCTHASRHAVLGCDPMCAAALPLPDEGSDARMRCPATVAIGRPTPDGVDVEVVRAGYEDRVEFYFMGTEFQGLDEAERERLAVGGSSVALHLGRDPRAYAGPYDVADVPARKPTSRLYLVFGLLLALVLVGLAALVIVFGLKLRRRPSSG